MTDFFMRPLKFGGDPSKGADTQEWSVWASDDGGVTKVDTGINLISQRAGFDKPFVRTYHRHGVMFDTLEEAVADWRRSL